MLRVAGLLLCLCLVGCAGQTSRLNNPQVVEPFESSTDDSSMEGFADDEFSDLEDEFAEFEEEMDDNSTTSADPLEPWNRAVFRFNDKAYDWVLRPLTKGYCCVTPDPVRTGTRNFFHNLAMPLRAVNCLLQGKFEAAGREVGRFGINSVIGVFGCVDAAADLLGWQAQNEDLGQTLGAWGLEGGPYLVWPLAGPSTLRDSVARGGDYFLKPLRYVDPWELELSLKSVEYTNTAADSIEQYDAVKVEALEPYIAMREGFLQYRRRQVEE